MSVVLKDVDKMLFHASSVGHLLVDAKASSITPKQLETIKTLEAKDKLTDKQREELDRLIAKRDAPEQLSVGAKSHVRKCWRQYQYEMQEPLVTDVLTNGKLSEQASIDLVSRVWPSGDFRANNTDRKKDDNFTGEIDVLLYSEQIIEDVKSSFTIDSFDEIEKPARVYVAQAQVYMHLWGVEKYRLHYCLVDTPTEVVERLARKLEFKFLGGLDNPDCQEAMDQLYKSHSVSHIPEEDRVKTFLIDYNPAYIEKLKRRVDMAREYAKTLSLRRKPEQLNVTP